MGKRKIDEDLMEMAEEVYDGIASIHCGSSKPVDHFRDIRSLVAEALQEVRNEAKKLKPKKFNYRTKKPKLETPRTQNARHIIRAWKKLLGVEDDPGWDKLHYNRTLKTVNDLLDYFGGDKGKTFDCIFTIYKEFTSKGLTVTIETIKKHTDTYREKEMANERLNRTSNSNTDRE